MKPTEPNGLNLTPFRRRIRLLRMWRCAAIGGSVGAVAAIVMALLDLFNIRYFEFRSLAIPIVIGIAAGVIRAFAEQIPSSLVARSVDRRGHLEDRLTTAIEVPPSGAGFARALHVDAAGRIDTLRPATLYPLRPGRWHGALAALAVIGMVVFLLGNTGFLKSAQAKKDTAELQREGVEVERVIKPVLEDAKRPEAGAEDKALARRLENFSSELKKGRMSRPDALVKANQLAEEAKKLENTRSVSLSNSVLSAQTAAEKIQQMSDTAGLEKSDALKLSDEAAATERDIADMENKLKAPAAGKGALSKAERAALESKLAAAKNRLKNIQLSQRAEEFLRKLHANSDFQEAQELLAKLASNAAAQKAGDQPEMTQAQLDAAAKRLEDLAKQLDTDAKLKAFAKEMLEAAKRARQCKSCSNGLLSCFGLSTGGSRGAGRPSKDKWIGAHGTLNKSDKSSLLNVKLEDRTITSEKGDKGPQTYTEVLGPSTLGAKSSVPYQTVLPKYEKSAETAMNKSDIPPGLRTKVRDYFESLHK